MSPAACIAFRCDASIAIGTGHVRRCLSLAQALRQLGADCLFVTRQPDIDTAALIRAEDFECLVLPATTPAGTGDPAPDDTVHATWLCGSQMQDADDTLLAVARARRPTIDWLLADHYALDARWHGRVRLSLNCRVAAIDDLGDRQLDVELLVDHNYAADHSAKYAGRLRSGALLLGGPRFALLAPAYSSAPRHMQTATVRSIGIFMGGVDAPGLARLALKACLDAGFQGPVEIAATSACPHLAELRGAAAARPGTTLTLDQPDLAGFFARHDLQIGAGGGATWERCCLGVPTIALETAENQRQVLAPLCGLGVLEVAAPIATSGRPSLESTLRTLLADPQRRKALAARSRELVDGNGARRAAESLLGLRNFHLTP